VKVIAVADAEHRVVPVGVYLTVWAGLIVLTGLTVTASYAELHVAVQVALLIATVKASLVLLYFMHLRYEGRAYFIMLLVVLVTYAVFIGGTLTDYLFR
jgi:cytochrome c oxidase subunit IV